MAKEVRGDLKISIILQTMGSFTFSFSLPVCPYSFLFKHFAPSRGQFNITLLHVQHKSLQGDMPDTQYIKSTTTGSKTHLENEKKEIIQTHK